MIAYNPDPTTPGPYLSAVVVLVFVDGFYYYCTWLFAGEDFTLNVQGNVKRSKIYHACKEEFNIEGEVEDSYLKASPINAGEDYLTVAVACKGDAEIQGDLNDVNIVHADFDRFTGMKIN